MPVRSLFSGTQDLSPPRSFQSLLAGGHGRALASSQRVTSSWLPLWTSRSPKQLTTCLLWARPLQPWRWWSIRLPLRFPKHSDGATVIRIMADASSWEEASCRSRGPLAQCSRYAGCGDASREPASAGHRGSRTCQSGHFFRALRT